MDSTLISYGPTLFDYSFCCLYLILKWRSLPQKFKGERVKDGMNVKERHTISESSWEWKNKQIYFDWYTSVYFAFVPGPHLRIVFYLRIPDIF